MSDPYPDLWDESLLLALVDLLAETFRMDLHDVTMLVPHEHSDRVTESAPAHGAIRATVFHGTILVPPNDFTDYHSSTLPSSIPWRS